MYLKKNVLIILYLLYISCVFLYVTAWWARMSLQRKYLGSCKSMQYHNLYHK